MNPARREPGGFSLLEVIVAVGIAAVVLVTLLGWFGPAVRSAAATADAQTAAGLADDVQLELERLQAVLGLDGLAVAVPPAGANGALPLVATRDGRRVRCAATPDPSADRPLDDATLPGIAWRDRYFLAEVVRSEDLPYQAGAGFLALTVRVTWPFRLPAGPPTPGVTVPAADPSREVPEIERSSLAFVVVLRP